MVLHRPVELAPLLGMWEPIPEERFDQAEPAGENLLQTSAWEFLLVGRN